MPSSVLAEPSYCTHWRRSLSCGVTTPVWLQRSLRAAHFRDLGQDLGLRIPSDGFGIELIHISGMLPEGFGGDLGLKLFLTLQAF